MILYITFKVHVSKSSSVADHCRTYALSYPNDKDFYAACDHKHDDICDRSFHLASVIRDIEKGLEEADCTIDTREDLTFVISQAKKNINAWKSHLLRSINQDECRLDILKGLDNSSVLLVLDWAMKYLPRKFRESQSDWFGKCGIPWHITVAIRRAANGNLEMMTLVHLFESGNQDNCAVLAILNDVFCQLKVIMPELQSVHLRQDNASCYHCALTIVTASQVARINDLTLSSMDFSDPQGGKGSCDRKAATIKSHMTVHLNSGHDIETATQMKEAIYSLGGISGVEVRLCGPAAFKVAKTVKLEGVSLVNNIQFSEMGMQVWRAYNIGPGKLIKWGKFDVPNPEEVPNVKLNTSGVDSKATFVSIKSRKADSKPLLLQKQDQTKNIEDGPCDLSFSQHLFACPEEGCVKSYQRYSSLQKHLDCGKHKRALESETLFDRAILGYASKLEQGNSAVPEIHETELCKSSSEPSLPMGWALKFSGAGPKRFSVKQKEYLSAIFQIGERSGQKANPSSVSKTMRTAKDSNGVRLFSSHSMPPGWWTCTTTLAAPLVYVILAKGGRRLESPNFQMERPTFLQRTRLQKSRMWYTSSKFKA
jgi:hypothetical protein